MSLDEKKQLNQEEDTQKGRFLTFKLGEESFGLEIKYVTEIVGIQPITKIPEVPNYVKGIINLRGAVVPVVDLHLRLSIAEDEAEANEKIIIIEMDNIAAGMLVDDVDEIKGLNKEEIATLPDLARKVDSDYIEGVGRSASDEELILLLDLQSILSQKEIDKLKNVN